MRNLADMIWIELRKAWRSRIPLFTLLGFLMLPLAAAFFMVVLKDPETARKVGLISAKAQLTAGTADWPAYLGIFSQGIAVGGLILFSVISSWVFGREFSDGTVKDMLAVPVSRSAILLAKFIVVTVWSAMLTVIVYIVGLIMGAVIGLPQGSSSVLLQGSATLGICACLVFVVITPVAFFASSGRGYLPPMGIALLLIGLANVIVVAGWGSYFPWSIPGLYAGPSGADTLEPISYWIVALTGLAGIAGTYLWWKFADQSR